MLVGRKERSHLFAELEVFAASRLDEEIPASTRLGQRIFEDELDTLPSFATHDETCSAPDGAIGSVTVEVSYPVESDLGGLGGLSLPKIPASRPRPVYLRRRHRPLTTSGGGPVTLGLAMI